MQQGFDISVTWAAAGVIITALGAMLGGAFWLGRLQADKVNHTDCEKRRQNCVEGVNGMFSKIWGRIEELTGYIKECSERTARIEGKIDNGGGRKK